MRGVAVYIADAVLWLGVALCTWRGLRLEWLALMHSAPRWKRRGQVHEGGWWLLMSAILVWLALL